MQNRSDTSRAEPPLAPTDIVLETERAWLRKFTPDDVEAVFALAGDPEVMRYVQQHVNSLEEAAKILEQSPLADYRKYGFGRWAVVLKENGRIIGSAGLKYLEDLGEVDLGYLLIREYWGRGLATEIARALVRYGFDQLRLPRVLALVDSENLRSTRVLDKLGFKFAKIIQFRSATTAQYVLEAETNRV